MVASVAIRDDHAVVDALADPQTLYVSELIEIAQRLPLATADGRSLANDVRAGADTSAPDGVGRAAAQRARSSPTGTESPGIDIDLVALAYVSCNVGVDRHRVHQQAMIACMPLSH
jgi:hypothetical protein